MNTLIISVLGIYALAISGYALYLASKLASTERELAVSDSQWDSSWNAYLDAREACQQWEHYANALESMLSQAQIETAQYRYDAERIAKGEAVRTTEPVHFGSNGESASMTPLFSMVIPANYAPVVDNDGYVTYAAKPETPKSEDSSPKSESPKSESSNGSKSGKGKEAKTPARVEESTVFTPASNRRKSDKLNKEAKKQIGKAFGKRTEEVFSWLDSRDYDITTVDTATLIDRAQKSGKFN